MRSPTLALLCGLGAVAISGCGNKANPAAGSPAARAEHPGRAELDDPRSKRLTCMLQHHLPATKVGLTDIQIGPPPGGATVTFTPTPGAAQSLQINGQARGAEVIGSALLYPNQASENDLKVIEDCVSLQVKG